MITKNGYDVPFDASNATNLWQLKCVRSHLIFHFCHLPISQQEFNKISVSSWWLCTLMKSRISGLEIDLENSPSPCISVPEICARSFITVQSHNNYIWYSRPLCGNPEEILKVMDGNGSKEQAGWGLIHFLLCSSALPVMLKRSSLVLTSVYFGKYYFLWIKTSRSRGLIADLENHFNILSTSGNINVSRIQHLDNSP